MPCDRLSSPLLVISQQLRMRRNEMSNSLLAEVKTDSVKSCKVSDAL